MQAIVEFEVDGVFEDFSDIVTAGGLKIVRNDIDSQKTGRSKLNAKMHRTRLAIKYKLSFSCMRMGKARMQALTSAIQQETFRVRYPNFNGEPVIRTVYGSTVESAVLYADGNDVYWDGATFNLIEV